jgi:diguanylate cyclase (GGDEF)-like protein/PAS domain S-box-containing protein
MSDIATVSGPRASRITAAISPSRRKTARLTTSDDPLRGLLWLVTLMLTLGMVVLLGVFVYFARQQDLTAVRASVTIVRSGLENRERELARIVRDLAWSDDSVAHLVEFFDPAWAEAAIGPMQVEENSIDASYVIDPENQTILAYRHGQRDNIDAFHALSGGLDELLSSSRASPRGALRAAAGVLMFEGAPHLVVAGAITTRTGSISWTFHARRWVIVLVRPLDPAFVTRLGTDLHINDLRLVGPDGVTLAGSLPLVSPDGPVIGLLTWSPELPARQLFIGIGPIAAGIGVVVMALYGLFLLRSRQVGILLARQAKVIEHVHEGLILTDPFGIITGWNAGAARMFGYSRAEVIGRSAAMLLTTPASNSEVGAIVRSFDEGRESADLELFMCRKEGAAFPVQLFLSPIRDGGGKTVGTIGYHVDISARKQLEHRLEQLATIDELTGAYNRRHLLQHGTVEMERARRFKRALSFLFIDLDHFKAVNDRFGHGFGDMVLSTLAQTCRNLLRPADMLVRYGGEEFVVVMPETSQEQAVLVASRLASRVRETVYSNEPPFRGLTISIGITTLRNSDETLEKILERADKAMYRAKELGRDRIEVAA